MLKTALRKVAASEEVHTTLRAIRSPL